MSCAGGAFIKVAGSDGGGKEQGCCPHIQIHQPPSVCTERIQLMSHLRCLMASGEHCLFLLMLAESTMVILTKIPQLWETWLQGYRTFFLLINTEIAKIMEISGLNHQSQSFIPLIKVKMHFKRGAW